MCAFQTRRRRAIRWFTTMTDRDGDKVRQLKRGLWDNIRAKRERGEKPAKPGDKDYPDQKQWRKLSGQGR